jgi:hypothetical protein
MSRLSRAKPLGSVSLRQPRWPTGELFLGQRIKVNAPTYRGYATVVGPPGFMRVVRYAMDKPDERVFEHRPGRPKVKQIRHRVTAIPNVRVVPYDATNPLSQIPEAHREYLVLVSEAGGLRGLVWMELRRWLTAKVAPRRSKVAEIISPGRYEHGGEERLYERLNSTTGASAWRWWGW